MGDVQNTKCYNIQYKAILYPRNKIYKIYLHHEHKNPKNPLCPPCNIDLKAIHIFVSKPPLCAITPNTYKS